MGIIIYRLLQDKEQGTFMENGIKDDCKTYIIKDNADYMRISKLIGEGAVIVVSIQFTNTEEIMA